jgi:hypothetical protein
MPAVRIGTRDVRDCGGICGGGVPSLCRIGTAYLGQLFLEQRAISFPSSFIYDGSPCTHVVVFGHQRQTDALKSVEQESRASVELFKHAGEMGWEWDELWRRGGCGCRCQSSPCSGLASVAAVDKVERL